MASRNSNNTIDCKEQLLFTEIIKGEFRGYKQDLLLKKLDEIEVEFYVCTKCNGIMRNACEIGEEQTSVCETCAGRVKTRSKLKSRKKILELKVKCPLQGRGCEWNGTLVEIEMHLGMCSEFIVDCVNKCGVVMKRSMCKLPKHYMDECQNRITICDHCRQEMKYKMLENHYTTCVEFPLLCPNECKEKLKRKEVSSHVQNECPNTILNCINKCGTELKRCEMQNHCQNKCLHRKVNCKHCRVIILFKEIDTHNKTCPEFPLLCSNECLKELTRKLLKSHIENDCPNSIIECLYKKMGCEEMMKRKEMEDHEKRLKSKHLKLMANKMLEMDQFFQTGKKTVLNEKLEAENEKLSKNCHILEKRLIEMDCRVKELTEKITYPVVLADELKKELIDSILSKGPTPGDAFNVNPCKIRRGKNPSQEKGDRFRNPRGIGRSHTPMHYSSLTNTFEFRWKELDLHLTFAYETDKKLIKVSFNSKVDWKRCIKKILKVKFKLTIFDTINIQHSLVFWSKVEESNPLKGNSLEIAEIPQDKMMEERLRTKNQTISFMLQMQEVYDFLM